MKTRKYLGQIVNGKYVKSGIIDSDIKQPKENAHHREYVRNRMREDYARDLVQPNTPEFAEAFPNKIRRPIENE